MTIICDMTLYFLAKFQEENRKTKLKKKKEI